MDENVLGNVVGSLIDRNRDENCWGGGFMWVILLLFLVGGGGFGWGNRGNIATTTDVAGATAYNQVDNGIRSLERGQATLGYNTLDQFNRTNMLTQGVGNNMERAIAESTFATKDCCCTTNRNIDAVKYDVTRNIDAIRYQMAQDTCAVINNDTNNTQKVLDRLCAMETNALKSENERLRFELQAAQLVLANGQQTKTIVETLRPPVVPAYVVNAPYTGIGYNYGTQVA